MSHFRTNSRKYESVRHSVGLPGKRIEEQLITRSVPSQHNANRKMQSCIDQVGPELMISEPEQSKLHAFDHAATVIGPKYS